MCMFKEMLCACAISTIITCDGGKVCYDVSLSRFIGRGIINRWWIGSAVRYSNDAAVNNGYSSSGRFDNTAHSMEFIKILWNKIGNKNLTLSNHTAKSFQRKHTVCVKRSYYWLKESIQCIWETKLHMFILYVSCSQLQLQPFFLYSQEVQVYTSGPISDRQRTVWQTVIWSCMLAKL